MIRDTLKRPMPRHGPRYTKYKICLSITMSIYIEQHLSNIWSSIHKKVEHHWSWVEKSVAYEKSVYRLYI